MDELRKEWSEAITRVARARSSRILMPAALIVSLDMFDQGDAQKDSVLFESLEQRFRTLLREVAPESAQKAWLPFYHLSTNSRVWVLYKGGVRASFTELPGNKPKSRAHLVRCSDCARFRPDLTPGVADQRARAAVRRAICELLHNDDADDSRRLAQACSSHE